MGQGRAQTAASLPAPPTRLPVSGWSRLPHPLFSQGLLRRTCTTLEGPQIRSPWLSQQPTPTLQPNRLGECEDGERAELKQGQVTAEQARKLREESSYRKKGRGAQGTRGNCLRLLMAFIGGWGAPPPRQNRQGPIVSVQILPPRQREADCTAPHPALAYKGQGA